MKRSTQYLLKATAVAVVCLAPMLAPAWGWFGHHVTMHLAKKEMEPEALAAVKELLGDEPMTEASVWADRVRPQRPETAPFHFVNAPRGVLTPTDDDLHIPQGNAWAAVLGYSQMLADETVDHEERVEALRFLLHFIGDIHQPLHTGFSDDRGANDVPVMFRDRRLNLHRIWDTEILDPFLGMDAADAAAIIFSRYSDEDRAAWAAVGDPVDWITEGRSFIFAGIYPMKRVDVVPGEEIAVIDEVYLEVWSPVAALQLARAGTRTAAVLNAIFVTGASPFEEPPIPFPPARIEPRRAGAPAGD